MSQPRLFSSHLRHPHMELETGVTEALEGLVRLFLESTAHNLILGWVRRGINLWGDALTRLTHSHI